MDDGERLIVLTTASQQDGVRSQIEKAVGTHGKHRDLVMKQLPHVSSALQALRDGHGDMVAISAFDWLNEDTQDLMVAGVLPRKEPTWVMVGPDKPEYLPMEAVVVCEHELLRRQLRRLRADVVVVDRTTLADERGELDRYNAMDPLERWPWVEEKMIQGHISGFIVPRAVHTDARMKSRRHTLGLQRDPTEQERERFVPPPLHGFALLVTRHGFPTKTLAEMADPSAYLAWRMESSMLESMDQDMQGLVGIYVEQRKLRTILKSAKNEGDEMVLDALVDPEDPNKKVLRGGPRLEFMIETLSPEGTVTASCHRIVATEDGHMGMVNVLKEFTQLVALMTTDHEAMKRGVPGMPPAFMEPSPRMLTLRNEHPTDE
jgi:hypothetical protein